MTAFDKGFQARMEFDYEEGYPPNPFENSRRQAWLRDQWNRGWQAAQDQLNDDRVEARIDAYRDARGLA